MHVISSQATVAANSPSGNVLAGNLFEFPARPTGIVVRISAAAVGMTATFSIGGVIIMEDVQVSDSNRFPQIPEDVLVGAGALPGERLFLNFRNTTGAAMVVKFVLDLS